MSRDIDHVPEFTRFCDKETNPTSSKIQHITTNTAVDFPVLQLYLPEGSIPGPKVE